MQPFPTVSTEVVGELHLREASGAKGVEDIRPDGIKKVASTVGAKVIVGPYTLETLRALLRPLAEPYSNTHDDTSDT